MYENEAPPFQIPSPVSVKRHLKEYDFILSRDPFSSSSLAPLIENQGQPSAQQQGLHFMEQRGTGSSVQGEENSSYSETILWFSAMLNSMDMFLSKLVHDCSFII
ncbi:hypothetical protein D5086_027823 [Populus alba]|uniref:Uncharacterized protein n=1 Tax=Populus alba TaxID=43335 RepID=A0ACC4AX27_POPAL